MAFDRFLSGVTGWQDACVADFQFALAFHKRDGWLFFKVVLVTEDAD